jgi:hypothetical protein
MRTAGMKVTILCMTTMLSLNAAKARGPLSMDEAWPVDPWQAP